MYKATENLAHPTARELKEFNIARERNQITFFRTARCSICSVEIPNAFETCSSECADKLAAQKDPTMSDIAWNINLAALSTGKVRIETHEGSVRTGKITRIETFDTVLPGKTVKTPNMVILDEDAADGIKWSSIREMKKL